MVSVSNVKTAFGEAYMKRLCRHFSHKIPARVDGNAGRLEFPFGVCRIDVTDQAMRIEVEAENADALARAESVVADHLQRMANRDHPDVRWERQAAR